MPGVKELLDLRNAYAQGPGPTQQPQFGTPQLGAVPMSFSGGQQVAGMPSTSGHGTVDFGGKKVAAGLVNYAQQISSQFGLRLSSGWRDPSHNRAVNGVPNSWHLRDGDHGALDFSGSAKQMAAGAAWAKTNGAREVLIHNAGSGQHLHVAW